MQLKCRYLWYLLQIFLVFKIPFIIGIWGIILLGYILKQFVQLIENICYRPLVKNRKLDKIKISKFKKKGKIFYYIWKLTA